jgi:hypothetical protein
VRNVAGANWRLIAGSLLTLVLTGAAIGLHSTSENARLLRHREAGNPETAPSAGARLEASFALFGSNPEGIPEKIFREVRKRPPAAGLKWGMSQRLPTGLRDPFWVVPGNSALCLMTLDENLVISASCAKMSETLKHGLTIVTIKGVPHPEKGGARLIVGLAPNYAHKVEIETGKTRQVIALKHHIFIVRDLVGLPPTRVTFR